MKKINVAVGEIGFTNNSSASVQEAFVKHLVRKSNATNTKVSFKNEINQSQHHDGINFPVQLEFDFNEENRLLRKKA